MDGRSDEVQRLASTELNETTIQVRKRKRTNFYPHRATLLNVDITPKGVLDVSGSVGRAISYELLHFLLLI